MAKKSNIKDKKLAKKPKMKAPVSKKKIAKVVKAKKTVKKIVKKTAAKKIVKKKIVAKKIVKKVAAKKNKKIEKPLTKAARIRLKEKERALKERLKKTKSREKEALKAQKEREKSRAKKEAIKAKKEKEKLKRKEKLAKIRAEKKEKAEAKKAEKKANKKVKTTKAGKIENNIIDLRSKFAAANTKGDFKNGDYIVYPSHGIGKIIEIESTIIMNQDFSCYLMFFEKEKLTIKVPVKNSAKIGLRHLVSKEQMEEVFTILRSGVKKLKGMWSRRAQEYESKINSGDILALSEVLRDLTRDVDDGERSYSERIIYETAVARLAAEYAAIYGIDLEVAKEKVISTAKDKINSEAKNAPDDADFDDYKDSDEEDEEESHEDEEDEEEDGDEDDDFEDEDDE